LANITDHSSPNINNEISPVESVARVTSKHEWNINAPVFECGIPNATRTTESRENGTQTEGRPTTQTTWTQTDLQLAVNMVTTGSQCESEKRSIGVICNIRPSVKTKHIQATTTSRTLGISAVVETQHSASQCQKYQKKVVKHDVGVWCNQSPGAVGRHTQTDKKISVGVKKKVAKHDVGVWCKQSPGAVGRHMQTDKNISVGAKTNTDTIITKNVGTETERMSTDWDDTAEMDAKLLSELWEDYYSEDEEVEESSMPQKGRVGRHALAALLQNLEVDSSSLVQYPEKINNVRRNKKVKGLIQCKTTNTDGEVKEKDIKYWAVMDDINLSVYQLEGIYHVGRYVKSYGDYEGLMCSNEEATEFTLVDPHSDCFWKCQDVVWSQLDPKLQQIRSRHVKWEPYGGYQGGYSYGGGYGNRWYDRELGGGY
jgi:hypothetical protein